ncbi:MAG: manganese efflux pump [Deltaproteobacteria bacterium]|nr:manganese efflux pump [Deltaproteobacteria bacterium]
MSTFKLLVIAVALAMDAFAVSVAVGTSLKKISFRQIFRLSWHFGFFQAAMPVLGWCAGLTIREQIERYDHWIAFGLLAFAGTHMIREAFSKEEESKHGRKDPTKGATLIMLSLATSIDALAIGLSLSLLKISIWYPAFFIGIVAGLFTMAGMHIGSRLGSLTRISHFGEVTGGIVLFLIAFNILHEHGALPF